MSIPALRELRRIFPEAHITLHTRSWADGLFRDASFLDELVTFDKARWAIKDVYDNSKFLKGDAFDLAMIFPNSFEAAITSFLSNVPRRIGYNKDLRGLLLTDPIAVPEWKDRKHEVYYYLGLVAEAERRLLGRDTVSQTRPNISLEVSDERRVAAKQLLADAGALPDKITIALGPGSTNSRAKRWPAERFAQLNDRLQSDLSANVVLVGAKNEKDVAHEVVRLSTHKPIDLCGETELGEAVALLASVDLFISNDMGLAHVASAVGTQTRVIFGPTNPETTRPFAGNADIIREPVECSPCMLRDCPIDHRCMTRISVERVMEAATSVFDVDDEEIDETAGYIS